MPAAVAIKALAEILRALGDFTRLRLVAALSAPGVKELCVCDLASLVGVSQSAVSHSLRVLRDLRLVEARRVSKIAFYALADIHVTDLLHTGFAHVDEQADNFAVAAADGRATARRRVRGLGACGHSRPRRRLLDTPRARPHVATAPPTRRMPPRSPRRPCES